MAGTAGKAIHYKGIEGVLSGYKLQGTPYYAIYQDKQLLFTNDDDDNETALSLLTENLQALQASGTTALHTICFYKDLKGGAINKNTPESGSFNFRITEPETTALYRPGNNTFNPAERYYQMLEEQNRTMLTELQTLRERIEDMDNVEEVDSSEDDGLGVIGLIGKAGERYPWMQDLIHKGILMLNNLVPGGMPANRPSGAIAGVPDGYNDAQRLNWALETMIKYYDSKQGEQGGKLFADDMVKLATLATEKPFIFDAAIAQLKNL